KNDTSQRCLSAQVGNQPRDIMQVLYESCAGLDVHKASVVAWVMVTGKDGKVQSSSRTFGTVTAEVLALSDWLKEHKVTHVAMESTGVYWKPLYNLLEGL